MEGKIELTDPDHPEARKAAEATARLLVKVRERRSAQDATNAEAKSAGGEPDHISVLI